MAYPDDEAAAAETRSSITSHSSGSVVDHQALGSDTSRAEDALIPLSALQHHLFCPRQNALIHIEGLWAEDAATAEGKILHERVDGGGGESRPGVRVARGIALRSLALGVAGKADAVEFRGRPPQPFPVEYKRGKPKSHRADEVQLCAQGICLEEAFGTTIPEGALFYGVTRRRQAVVFDATLRALTARVAAEARAMIASGRTPLPVKTPACRRCSLQDLCRPDRLEKPPRIARWLAHQIEDRPIDP
ncbi:CRISPR-associated protein Cas4 [Methylobacterium sp. Leaf466]|uniref:CRISPR-associated protein Cas4 n=1 Tax=Methylobacterium sp. Leaf466 TaxID=1736386 RepID=UPI000A6E34D9|nr:CRISPR-associated protein Cas4 [Methylobacterium sp. Leaf466]